MTSLPHVLLIAASFLTVALSIVVGAAAGYELGGKLVLFEHWTLGGHKIGTLLLAAAGASFAVLKIVLAIHWAREPLSRHRAAFAFVVWSVSLAYGCTTVMSFVAGPLVHPDAPASALALVVGLCLAIEVSAGLLPAIVWQGKATTERATALHEPPELRKSNATLPAILDLLALLHHLATGPQERGVQKTRDGRLVTTQRRLAALAGIAAGQVNKELHRLRKEGAITLMTSSRRTVIGLRSCSPENRYLSGRNR